MMTITREQMVSANCLAQEIAKLPEAKQVEFIKMMKAILLGANLAEQARDSALKNRSAG